MSSVSTNIETVIGNALQDLEAVSTNPLLQPLVTWAEDKIEALAEEKGIDPGTVETIAASVLAIVSELLPQVHAAVVPTPQPAQPESDPQAVS
jgi:hypothetical protein